MSFRILRVGGTYYVQWLSRWFGWWTLSEHYDEGVAKSALNEHIKRLSDSLRGGVVVDSRDVAL